MSWGLATTAKAAPAAPVWGGFGAAAPAAAVTGSGLVAPNPTSDDKAYDAQLREVRKLASAYDAADKEHCR